MRKNQFYGIYKKVSKIQHLKYHLCAESKWIKVVNITKQKQANRYREQISGYLWRGKWGGARWDKALRGINYYV